MLRVRNSIRARCTTLYDKVWQVGGFPRVLRFPPSIKLIAMDITEISLNVALNTIKQTNKKEKNKQTNKQTNWTDLIKIHYISHRLSAIFNNLFLQVYTHKCLDPIKSQCWCVALNTCPIRITFFPNQLFAIPRITFFCFFSGCFVRW